MVDGVFVCATGTRYAVVDEEDEQAFFGWLGDVECGCLVVRCLFVWCLVVGWLFGVLDTPKFTGIKR